MKRTTDRIGYIVSPDISIELTAVVSQKVRGKWKRKHVSFFVLKHMDGNQYNIANELLISGITPIGQFFLDAGYDMTFQGKPIEGICD